MLFLMWNYDCRMTRSVTGCDDAVVVVVSFVDEAADAVVAVLAADLVAAPAEVVKGITLLLLLLS